MNGGGGLRKKIDKEATVLMKREHIRGRNGCLVDKELQNGQAVLRVRERNGKQCTDTCTVPRRVALGAHLQLVGTARDLQRQP